MLCILCNLICIYHFGVATFQVAWQVAVILDFSGLDDI